MCCTGAGSVLCSGSVKMYQVPMKYLLAYNNIVLDININKFKKKKFMASVRGA